MNVPELNMSEKNLEYFLLYIVVVWMVNIVYIYSNISYTK